MHSKKILKKNHKQKIVVAMSGGVDSSVAAAILKKSGYDVIGVFLKFWSPLEYTRTGSKIINTNEHENICCSHESADLARSVAEKLKIPFYVLNVSKEFKSSVVDYYIKEYESGRTPNPCVMCNKYIKFGWLLKKAKELGAEYIATGHYVRLWREFPISEHQFLGKSQNPNSKCQIKLLKAKDLNKDQSYFLWQLSQNQLKHILFPLGNYTKPKVRELARKFGLPTAEKKESQNICFVPDNNNSKFLSSYSKKSVAKGRIVDITSNKQVIGMHKGLMFYTVGQRHGLDGVQLNGKGTGFVPAYVVRLDIKKNELVVGEEKDLYSKELLANKINFINPLKNCNSGIKAKIRYGHLPSRGKLEINNNNVKFIFGKPQRAITPGQSVAFYCGDELLGGGIIE